MDLSADSIHNLGLQEVARIRAEMDEIIKDLKFEGSFADFLQFLRTDPQFYAKTPEEIMKEAAGIDFISILQQAQQRAKAEIHRMAFAVVEYLCGVEA